MKRLILVVVLVLVGASLLLASTPSANATEPVQLQTRALGKDLGDWLEMYAKWWSVPSNPDHHGRYIFMPLPAGECTENPVYDDYGNVIACDTWTGEIDVSLKRNQGFFLSLMVWTGWLYFDGTTDPVEDDSVFLDADVDFRVDGVPMIYSDDGSGDSNVADFLVGPQWYKQPLRVPAEWGYAADVFAQGVGLLCPPLSPGTHVLHLDETVPSWGKHWVNTWNITVDE
jgi:hypothetical protein